MSKRSADWVVSAAPSCSTNLSEGVLKPDIYDPALNPLYRDMLAHYGVFALPCRVADPDRKAYASHCTSCELQKTFSGNRRRLASLTPCALRGGLGPGSSYSQSSRSFTGEPRSMP